jgi:ribonucleoside-triphosphate reductase
MKIREVIKRDGRVVPFQIDKIVKAIEQAFIEVDGALSDADIEIAWRIARAVANYRKKALTVEEIQDEVEKGLMNSSRKNVAKAYILYREQRALARENTIDKTIFEITEGENEYWKTENSNKDATLQTTVRDYIAGAVSTDEARRKLLPKQVIEAHDKGIIHFHDMDYFIQKIYNCALINLDDMLQNGTVISKTKIDKPHKFSTACNIATQIIAQVASSQYGGQSISLAHLSKFVDDTKKYFAKCFPTFSEEQIEALVDKDIRDGVQTLQYQIVTLMTTNGQAPFITVYMNLREADTKEEKDNLARVIAEVLRQRIKGVKNEKGVYITPAFPKIVYALDEDNTHKDSEYYWLTELAAKCTAKRMVPDYTSNLVQEKLKGGDTYPPMGCRSFLTPDRFSQKRGNVSNAKNFDPNKHKYYGRFNMGVVTLNLVDAACSSKGNEEEFWKLMDERAEICHKALRCRYERLRGTSSDVAPILWQHGAIARLKKGETIDKLLVGGYATISLGYAGLFECTKFMTGHSHTDEEGKPFALKVMQFLNDKCAQWKTEEDIDYSVYGTPLESTTYKFAKKLKERFGEIKDVTDHDYITNSYHVCVREEIDAFTKLGFESEFQALSPGGAISYVEVPNMQNNIPAVLQIIDFIYHNIMYAELNTKSDYCQVCGYEGEIVIEKREDGKLGWKCPNCGNTDQNKMNVARRTCGYIGTNFWNQGRTQEIADRVLHIDK